GSGALSVKALYAVGDDRVRRYTPAVAANGSNPGVPAGLRYYHADGLGSTRLLTDEAGSVTDKTTFEAFGEIDAAASQQTSDNNFLYTGEQLDPNSGFYYLRARYMDPRVGRFTQQDTFAGVGNDPASLHKYLYANDNPAVYVDPSGRSALALGNGVATAALALAIRVTIRVTLIAAAATVTGYGVHALLREVRFSIYEEEGWASQRVLTPQQEKQKQAEYEIMKGLSVMPPDPGSGCGPLSRNIHHAKAVIFRYRAWDALWFPGRHVQKIADWERRLENLKKEHNRNCT
ncbi:RHS repeat-associated core domain-containing protein, partial [Limnofasciculus baicalensis]